MAIVQKNQYLPGQNLTNLALNVDLHHLGIDKTNITVDFGTTQATVTIKEGSIIEVNGNLYAIEGADYSFQMSNATHNFITFTDNPNPTFSSAATEGTYQDDKIGFYQAGNLIRTLGWYIDQVKEIEYKYELDKDIISVSMIAGSSSTIDPVPFDTIITDNLGNFDIINHRFIPQYSGEYTISLYIYCGSGVVGSGIWGLSAYYMVNGVSLNPIGQCGSYWIAATSMSINKIISLKAGDIFTIKTSASAGSIFSAYMAIKKI